MVLRRKRSINSFDDVEGLAVSIGLLFAILLPGAMMLQQQGFNEMVLSKNFATLLCTQPTFRQLVVDALEQENYDFYNDLGDKQFVNTKDMLENSIFWDEDWEKGSAKTIYDCQFKPEIAAATRILQEATPSWTVETWALMNPEAPLWSEHMSSYASFGTSVMLGGLVGCMCLFVSLIMSPCREDESGEALRKWCIVGYPLLGINLLVLVLALILMLCASDAYTESQDYFFVRAGRMSGSYKVACLAIFMPLVIVYCCTTSFSLWRSFKFPDDDDDGFKSE